MINYIKGIVTFIEANYIVIEANSIGYMVFVSNPYSFELDKETVIYTYNYVREDEYSLYGFKSLEEKNFNLKSKNKLKLLLFLLVLILWIKFNGLKIQKILICIKIKTKLFKYIII